MTVYVVCFFFSILRYSCIQSDFRCLAYAEKTNESILFFINFLLNYCVYARTSPLCSQCQTLGIIRIRIYLHRLAHTDATANKTISFDHVQHLSNEAVNLCASAWHSTMVFETQKTSAICTYTENGLNIFLCV